MLFADPRPGPDPARRAIEETYRCDEAAMVRRLADEARLDADASGAIEARARTLVDAVRRRRRNAGGDMEAFLAEYRLSSEEGVVLMCLAEALLRVPDATTANRLIRDKLGEAHWERHLGHSDSVLVNASAWALMLTGRMLRRPLPGDGLGATLRRMLARSGEPVVRQALLQAMRILGRQFVMGRTIAEALERAGEGANRRYRYSYDMLGEAAMTMDDAARYFRRYREAIAAVGRTGEGAGPNGAPGISVKLSALHPRYEPAQHRRVIDELAGRILELARDAAQADINLTIDAEEAERLEPSLDVLEILAGEPSLSGWQGLGLALQAYQKRAPALIDWLGGLARRGQRRFMVRLVKGAYWDSEIKRAQERGLDGYPVYTRKANTDVAYLACARRLFADPDAFYPQIATHNAHTVAAVLHMAPPGADFEFQRLHGMGEDLYDALLDEEGQDRAVRVYAPVGSHEDLLPYLVRRLLENGANTSFVHRILDEDIDDDDLVADPVARVDALEVAAHPRIAPPRDIFLPQRLNSAGIDLTDPAALRRLDDGLDKAEGRSHAARPLVDGSPGGEGEPEPVRDPACREHIVGTVLGATPGDIERAFTSAARFQPDWDSTPAGRRAEILDAVAALYEARMTELIALAVREAGKTVRDALAEVREAVDFCRYYAARARAEFTTPEPLPGPTGEANSIALRGRGVFVCISPWNFPLAIFTGQVAAALAAGNTVLAKPAEQTPLIAAMAVSLMHEAGVPAGALHLLPGSGEEVGAALVRDRRCAGVAFTGSTTAAAAINRALAARDGPIVPLIAETGGQNAFIVDSTALAEQAVADLVVSAFHAAGQRCSAARVLFVHEAVADRLAAMLAGAMEELRLGDPGRLATDVGPVIDAEALGVLEAHSDRMDREGRLLGRVPTPAGLNAGTFFAPRLYEIESTNCLHGEVFGPILHLIRYASDRFDAVLDAINATGYGLTLGLHSRIDGTADYVGRRVRVGNVYVNRNIVGAVVGAQPFGGEGLSGTGPKAGGPRYLHRFATERTVSVNTTASGGNAALLTLDD